MPSELGAATSLVTLALNHNALTSLPTELGLLTALTTLYVQFNELGGIGGALPTELNELTALTKACAPLRLPCVFQQAIDNISSRLGVSKAPNRALRAWGSLRDGSIHRRAHCTDGSDGAAGSCAAQSTTTSYCAEPCRRRSRTRTSIVGETT